MRSLIILTCILLCSFSLLMAQTAQTQENQVSVSDSLLALMESRMNTEYGISYNSTLEQVSEKLELDITKLKEYLGLDKGNTKLDKMRLRQLGISVYQVLLAQETIQYGFNEASTLLAISNQLAIPVKKLKHLLELDPNDSSLNGRSIQSLNKSPEEVLRAAQVFKDTLPQTGNSIILVGMIVVFLALLVTSVIIMQLRHLNTVTKEDAPAGAIKISSGGKLLSVHPSQTADDIVAVITALQIHKKQLEERKRILLTFHRNKANYWRSEGIFSMPNRVYSKNHN